MLDVDSVRRVARDHGYAEVQFNEASRVIAFEKSDPGRCRVNVYYTTGTVATCLDHPRSGKTQLFRRGQTLGDVEAVFRDPRRHTGVGYFRSNDRGTWQPVDGHGRPKTFQKNECDDALRWRFIHSTQEGFCNESQANQIAALCKLWTQMRFAPNDCNIMTTAEKFNSMPAGDLERMNDALRNAGLAGVTICDDCEETRCGCMERAGAWCCLTRALLKVAKATDGVEGVMRQGGDETRPLFMSSDQLMDCQCNDGMIFRQRHATFLEKLERQLMSFPPKIRRELLWWLISKQIHGYEPFMIIPSEEASEHGYEPFVFMKNEEGSCEKTFSLVFFGHALCSDGILRAHHDYGEMAYSKDQKKGCNCHGI